MPQHKSAIKRVRQNEKRRKQNRQKRSRMRTLYKKVLDTTEKGKAEEFMKEATSYIDKMTAKGLIHQNNAARKKAKMTKHVNNL